MWGMDRLKVLVTGAHGFVGAALADALKASGYQVLTTDIRGEGTVDHVGDLTDQVFVKSMISQVKPDVVVHSAALVPLTREVGRYGEVNSVATKTLAATSRAAGAQKFVLIGSSAVYGRPADLPITRNSRVEPIEAYGRSKLQAEKAAAEGWGTTGGLTIIRPRTVVGPGRGGLFNLLFRWVDSGNPLPMPRGGKHLLQLVHVDDLARLVAHVIEQDVEGVWPAGAPTEHDLATDLHTIARAAESQTRVLYVPGWAFRLAARTAELLRMSPFSKWHYATLGADFVFDPSWCPPRFTYNYDNSSALMNCWQQRNSVKEHDQGELAMSPHRSSLPTNSLDTAAKLLRFTRRKLDN